MAELKIHGYKIDKLLARGGMAEVFVAEQVSLGRKVAIKVLDPQSGDPEFAERFLHEARLVASLNHANIITIYDFGPLDGGRFFLSMEYILGGDLENKMAKGISEPDAVKTLKEMTKVLSFIHKQDIVHRDIKPANILFRNDDSLVLTDFGIAKKVHNDVQMTRAGMTVGSPAYSSPEQAQGLELDQRADIYSTGVVFFEMLTGANPFKADTFIDTAIRHIQMDIPQLEDELKIYQPLINKMLAKKQEDRFQSADELGEFLLNMTSGPGRGAVQHKIVDEEMDITQPMEVTEPAAVKPQEPPQIEEEKAEALLAADTPNTDDKGLLDDLLDEELEKMDLDDLIDQEISKLDHDF